MAILKYVKNVKQGGLRGYKVKIMDDIDIIIKNGISNFNEINRRMKLILGKEIMDNKDGKYTIPKEVFIGKQIYDEVRYYLKVNSDGQIEESEYIGEVIKNETLLKKYKCYEKILIIVESPHRDEFTFNYEPIGPAQGETGYGIENKMGEIIEKMDITSRKCIVIISNPVQFQTSLGSFYLSGLNDAIRNNLWTKLYNKDRYLEVLKGIDAKYIINATTTQRRKRIKKVLQEYSNEIQNNTIIKTSNHPSQWRKKGIHWE